MLDIDSRYTLSDANITTILNQFYCDAKRAEIKDGKDWQHFPDIEKWWEKNSERYKYYKK